MKKDNTAMRRLIAAHPGLQDALCALSFYRARHQRRTKYKHATGRRAQQTVSVYTEYTRTAKRFIQQARAAGFRGSIRTLVTGPL
jgi:hypothetical protein